MTKLNNVFITTPGSSISYTIDWSDFLTTGDVITSSSWSLPAGVIAVGTSATDTNTSIRVSGGEACTSYEIVNNIGTSGGELGSQSFVLYYRNW